MGKNNALLRATEQNSGNTTQTLQYKKVTLSYKMILIQL